MLQKQLYFQAQEDEHIQSAAFGDSIQLRFVVLYTSRKRLIVISEDKFTRETVTQDLPWFPQDDVLAMKYRTEQFKLHVLTVHDNYYTLTLAAVFQPAFREEWLKLIASGERKQKSTRDVQIIRICGALVVNQENYSNVVAITDSAVSYRDVNALAEGCSDFLFWDIGHSGSDFFVIFMTRHGNALFFDFAKRVIPLIIEFSVSVLNFTLLAQDGQDFLIAVTELNDIIKKRLSYYPSLKQERKVLITAKYDDRAFQGTQVHRLSDQQLPAASRVFLTENSQGQKLVFLLQEQQDEQLKPLQTLHISEQRLLKYKAKSLKAIKKIYVIRHFEKQGLEIQEVVDHDKVLLLLVFRKDHFEVLTLAKKCLQEKSQMTSSSSRTPLFTDLFHQLHLIDDQGHDLSKYLGQMFHNEHPNTALIHRTQFQPGDTALLLTPFKYQFQSRVAKEKLRQTLLESDKQMVQVLDSQNSIVNKRSILLFSQQLYLLKIEVPEQCYPPIERGFSGLQQYFNFIQTYAEDKNNIIAHFFPANLSWQQHLVALLWCQTNCQNGSPQYLKVKPEIDTLVQQWVESRSRSAPETLECQFQTLEFIPPPQLSHFEKVLVTYCLLSFNSVATELTILILVELAFPKLRQSQVADIVKQNGESIGPLLAKLKETHRRSLLEEQPPKRLLQHQYWKDMQQLLFLCLILAEIQVTALAESSQTPSQKTSLLNKIESLIFDIQDHTRLLLIMLHPEMEDQLKLFVMTLRRTTGHCDWIKLLQFALSSVKLLYHEYPTLNVKSIYYLATNGVLPCDRVFTGNLLNLLEVGFRKKPKKNLSQQEAPVQVNAVLRRQLDKIQKGRYTLNETGCAMVLLLFQKLENEHLSERLLYQHLSLPMQQQMEIIKWFFD